MAHVTSVISRTFLFITSCIRHFIAKKHFNILLPSVYFVLNSQNDFSVGVHEYSSIVLSILKESCFFCKESVCFPPDNYSSSLHLSKLLVLYFLLSLVRSSISYAVLYCFLVFLGCPTSISLMFSMIYICFSQTLPLHNLSLPWSFDLQNIFDCEILLFWLLWTDEFQRFGLWSDFTFGLRYVFTD